MLRQKLVKIGLLETTDNEIIVNIKSMLGEYPRVCSENTEGYAGTHTIIYNNIEENIEEIDNGHLDNLSGQNQTKVEDKTQNQEEEEKEKENLVPSVLRAKRDLE